jgi:hypothetical protein
LSKEALLLDCNIGWTKEYKDGTGLPEQLMVVMGIQIFSNLA